MRIAIGLGQNNLTLALSIGANFFRLTRASGTQLIGNTLALGIHAPINVRADFRHQINTLQAHIKHLDTNAARIFIGANAQVIHNFVALAGNHFGQIALAKFSAQIIIHALRKPYFGPYKITAGRDKKLFYINDAIFDEGINQHIIFFLGLDTFRLLGVERLNPCVIQANIFNKRHLEIQTRAGLNGNHLA